MLIILKRTDTGLDEEVGRYEDGEFSGDENLVEGFAWAEGRDEERIMEIFSGPHHVAVRPDGAELPFLNNEV